MDGPEAVQQVRGARAYIVLVLSLTLKLPFFEQPSNVIFSKRIILLLMRSRRTPVQSSESKPRLLDKSL